MQFATLSDNLIMSMRCSFVAHVTATQIQRIVYNIYNMKPKIKKQKQN